MRLMRMTVVQACPWTQAPGACTMVPVWTWWVASVAPVPLDTLGCAVRQTSMNVTRVPAMGHTPGTACRPRVGASAASAEPASQVSVGEGAGLGPCLDSPSEADLPAFACPGPRCQTVLSPCESQPCQHGGQCSPGPGPGAMLTFTCQCVPVGGGGWSPQGLWQKSGRVACGRTWLKGRKGEMEGGSREMAGITWSWVCAR